MYYHPETQQTKNIYELGQVFPNMSLGVNPDLTEYGWFKVKENPQPVHDESTETIYYEVQFIGTQYETVWVIRPLTSEELKSRVPYVITMRQARIILERENLLDDIDALVATLDREAQITWEYSTEVQRNHPLVAAVQQLKGLTESQLDNMFISASKI
jgi:hypothetical protein